MNVHIFTIDQPVTAKSSARSARTRMDFNYFILFSFRLSLFSFFDVMGVDSRDLAVASLTRHVSRGRKMLVYHLALFAFGRINVRCVTFCCQLLSIAFNFHFKQTPWECKSSSDVRNDAFCPLRAVLFHLTCVSYTHCATWSATNESLMKKIRIRIRNEQRNGL